MAARVSGFRSTADADRYLAGYDQVVARHWPVPREELDVTTRFGPTHVRRCGPPDGVPILLVHPTTGSSVGWYPLIESLSRDHPVVMPDTIGTAGRSVQTAPMSTTQDLVTWLDDVLDALELDAVHVVGYSEGGWIAGTHAALGSRPDRVTTLTLIEPSGAVERVPRLFIAQLILRGGRTLLAADKHRALHDFNRWMNGDGYEIDDDVVDLLLMAFGTFRQRLPTPGPLSDEDLRRLDTPTLLLMGGATKLYDPERVADRARRLLPDVTIHVTPGAGHGLAFQHPEATVERILAFVDAHP